MTFPASVISRARTLLPGLALAGAITAASVGIAALETRVLGHPVIEGLVVAILLGMFVRTARRPSARFDAGVTFAAKELLEVAVFLLGLSVDLPLLLAAGPALAAGIVLLVTLGIAFSYGLGRLMGLPGKLAVLVACGNSICGNSAIAALAPVIDADAEHVASSIAFTAVLGVVVVVGLPLLREPLGLSFYQYGVLAGLTVYSVPQVLAAAFPVSTLSGQVGTLVKLVRVLMLGPVVVFFSLRHRATRRPATQPPVPAGMPRAGTPPLRLARLVPWFIVGFLLLAAVRATGVVPAPVVAAARSVSTWLTVIAMAALGLGCDLRAIARAGRRIVLTVSGSLVLLGVLSVGLIRVLQVR